MNIDVLNQRVNSLEDDCTDIKDTVKSIDKSLSALVKLEAHHSSTREGLDRAFRSLASLDKTATTAIKAIEERVRVIELELETLKMVRGWIIAGVIGVAGLAGTAVFKLISH